MSHVGSDQLSQNPTSVVHSTSDVGELNRPRGTREADPHFSVWIRHHADHRGQPVRGKDVITAGIDERLLAGRLVPARSDELSPDSGSQKWLGQKVRTVGTWLLVIGEQPRSAPGCCSFAHGWMPQSVRPTGDYPSPTNSGSLTSGHRMTVASRMSIS